MDSATGIPQRVLIVGGSSEIARALAEEWLDRGVQDFVLTSRTTDSAQDLVRLIREQGGTASEYRLDGLQPATVVPALDQAWESGDIDVAVIAIGMLEPQTELELEPTLAWDMVTLNATATIVIGLEIARRLRRQRHGTLVLLSSVAGARGRRDNYVYGASKAAVEVFGEGLRQSLSGEGVSVLVARPGYVHSRMSRDVPPAPFSVTTATSAAAITRAVAERRQVVWIPPVLGPIFWVLRLLPSGLWARVVRRVRPG